MKVAARCFGSLFSFEIDGRTFEMREDDGRKFVSLLSTALYATDNPEIITERWVTLPSAKELYAPKPIKP